MKRRIGPLLGSSEELGEESLLERKKVKLLIIDEQPWYGDVLKEHAEMCHDYDISCEVATTHEDVERLIRTWTPSVVMVDVHHTEIDSLDLIRKWEGGLHSVVAVSRERSKEIETSALSRGADAYVTKTENPDELQVLIERIAMLAPFLPELH
jgi:two-component system, NtrC family, response regulator AtoC